MTLRERMLRAGVWTVAGYAASQALRLGSNLIMTRLLAPEMFGVMAIAFSAIMLLSMFSDVGVRQNIVQSARGDDPEFLDSAWVLQIVRGVALWLAALILCAGLTIAGTKGVFPENSVFALPILPWVIAITSLVSVIAGFQSTKIALAQRHFEQKALVRVELTGQLCSVVVMVAVGLATRSIWSLVAGTLAGALVSSLLSHLWTTGPKNRFRVEREAFSELLRFGKWVFVSSGATVLASVGDRLLLGFFASADILGLFAIAALFVATVEGVIGRLMVSVTLPALSEIARENPGRLRDAHYRLRLPCDVAMLFAAGVLSQTGQMIVDLLYDSRYSGAGPMLQVLALALFASRYEVTHQIYLALGRTEYLALLNAVRAAALFALVPTLYLCAGLDAAVWGIALHRVATLPVIFALNARLGLNNFLRELQLLLPFPAGVTAGYLLSIAIGDAP